jgi:hypothetical protein
MDNSKIVFLINDQARALEAKYEDHAGSEVFKTMDPSIKVDDLVVVQSGTRHMMTVAKVTAVDVDVNFDSNTPIKWIVQRINADGFQAILAKEGEAISAVQAAELRRKKSELRKSMFAEHEDSIAKLSLTDRTIDAVTE